MKGLGGGNFLPASRGETPPPRALGAEAEAENFLFLLEKNRARAK